MRLDIVGTDLPGRTFGPLPQAGICENVHVGIGRHPNATLLVPGDAREARWSTDVTVKRPEAGGVDFRGPHVDGRRGDRVVYLSWGAVSDDGAFTLFRAAKLKLADVDPKLIDDADRPGRRLVGRLSLTDRAGGPVCATVRPSLIRWSVERD
jgi:hypothetical protein